MNCPTLYVRVAAVLRKLFKFLAWCVALAAAGILSGWITMNTLIKGEEIKVPDILGKTTEEAYQTLSEAGLYLSKVDTQPDEHLAPDRILSQDPPAGTAIKKNRKVRVIVSSGSETVTVPDLQDKSSRAASLVLREAGLRLGMVAQASSPRTAAGEVIAQQPEPGTEDLRDNSVNILVSSGATEPEFVMPDLIGKEVKAVAPALRDWGFQIGSVHYQNYPGIKPGLIIKQAPLAGYKIKKGNLVSLEVSQE
ncbi:MAG: PASTA domain-containing protein [Acidobacteriota bacterium]